MLNPLVDSFLPFVNRSLPTPIVGKFKAFIGNCGSGIPVKNSIISQPPAPETMDFDHNGYTEVKSANGNGCTINVKLKNTKSALIVISDGRNIVYQGDIVPSATSHFVNYNFIPGKNYRAMLLMDGELVHWQEIDWVIRSLSHWVIPLQSEKLF